MAALVKALDSVENLAILGFTHPLGNTYLMHLSDTELMSGMHLVGVDGLIKTGGDAEIAMLALLPQPMRAVGKAGQRFGFVAKPLKAAYSLIAANRSRLGRIVPDLPAVNREP
jgi:hypothetical protein